MDKLLTIVIPTYNMQDYLNRCLDSLVIEPSLMEQLEVLVVNDGSKDSSSAIAHEYEAKFPCTFRVIDKENGNYGSCVNRGLAEAQGKYIKVLDADDWFDTSEFERFLKALSGIEVDLVLSGFNIVKTDSSGGINVTYTYKPSVEALKIGNLQQMDYETLGAWLMHAITYRVQLLKSINYYQTEGISYTDTEWVYIPLYAVNTFTFIDTVVYQYLRGRVGQTVDTEVLIKSVDQYDKVVRRLVEHADTIDNNCGFGKKAIEKEIAQLVEMIYQTRLVKQSKTQYDNVKMIDFDDFIYTHRQTLWDSMGQLKMNHTHIRYVKYWRKHGKRFPVDWLREAYRSFRYGK